MTEVLVPTFDELMNPVIQALKELGESGTIEEINSKAIGIADLSDAQTEVLHKPEKGGGQTEVEYRLAWTRTYLKKYGLIDNSSRGVWALTPEGRRVDQVNPREVEQFVQRQSRETRGESGDGELDEQESWRDHLLNVLLEMEPVGCPPGEGDLEEGYGAHRAPFLFIGNTDSVGRSERWSCFLRLHLGG
jgi:restriction system protein